jgi:hypothetical protein
VKSNITNYDRVNATMLCIIAFTIGMLCTFSGCKTTHHFKTETLKHSSQSIDALTWEVKKW